ncbi:hypothetical protein U1Q18_037057 [Sarracenia purpurea var. burkii]
MGISRQTQEEPSNPLSEPKSPASPVSSLLSWKLSSLTLSLTQRRQEAAPAARAPSPVQRVSPAQLNLALPLSLFLQDVSESAALFPLATGLPHSSTPSHVFALCTAGEKHLHAAIITQH